MALRTASSTGTRDAGGEPWYERGALGLALGLATLLVLLLVDIAFDKPSAVLIGPFVAAPFVTALLAGPTATLVVGVLSVTAGLASPAWNAGSGDATDFYIRMAVIVGGSVFATLSSRNRTRAAARAERLHMLDAVGEVADGSLPLAETLRRVTDVIVPGAGDICVVDSVHEGRATRLAARASGRGDAREVEERLKRRKPSLPPWLVEVERDWRQIPRWLPKVADEDLRRMAHDPEDLEFLRSLGIRSSVVVPIAARDRNLGALSLLSAWSGRRYSADDVQFAQILASRVALALDNAGLFSDLESFERRMDTVMSIVDEAVVIHGPAGELLFANPAAARTLGFGSPEEAAGATAARIGERFEIRDEDGNECGPDVLAGPGALTAAPRTLRLTERRGGPERWVRTRSRPIAGADGEPLYAVTVIEDVTDVKRAEFSQRLLARTGELLSHSTDYVRTIDDAVHLLVPEFADGCMVSFPQPDGTLAITALAHREPQRERFAVQHGRPPAMRLDGSAPSAVAMRSGEAKLLGPVPGVMMGGFEASSAIVAPMSAGGETVGALAFFNEKGSRDFGEDDLELAIEVARRAGLAIENARLAGERARIADLLQRELLPSSLPEVPGWEIETMYQPAGELNEVGGDFYEVFPTARGWAIVLGDVSGHGAAAASLTAEARHTIRAAGTLAADPCAGLRLLDANLRGREDTALCSAVMLVVPDDAEPAADVEVYLAGHPHPLLVRGAAVAEVGDPGPALGVVEDPAWPPTTVRVREGEVIVLYTDGVIEARRDEGDRFGIARLRESLAGCERPETAISRVREGLASFLAREPDDDAALVVLRRSAAAWRPEAADRLPGTAAEPAI